MKVTALIPDHLIQEVQLYSKAENITQALLVALKEWTALKKIKQLNKKVEKRPLEFSKGFSAESVRELNRKI